MTENKKPLQSSEQQKWINADYYLDSIVRSSTDAIVGIDMQDVIRFWNHGAESLYGYPAQEAIGQSIFILAPEADAAEVAAMREKVSSKEHIQHYETAHRHKDGSWVHVSLNLSPIFDYDGNMVGISLITRDISEHRKAARKIEKQKQKLEAINKELNDFAHIISHDLKAPLRGISFVADWLYEDYAERLDEEGRENLKLLKSRVLRMATLIDGVLSYSRIEAKKEKIESVDLNILLAEVVDLLAPPAHIKIEIADLPTVLCGRIKMQQVFQNLLSNAIRYMDKEQGKISVACRDEGDRWCFSVQDNGPGIEEAHFERIFQIFQTLAPRDKVESTGVGLTIVKKIVELHGGSIWLESAVGAGTTFYFTLAKGLSADNEPV